MGIVRSTLVFGHCSWDQAGSLEVFDEESWVQFTPQVLWLGWATIHSPHHSNWWLVVPHWYTNQSWGEVYNTRCSRLSFNSSWKWPCCMLFRWLWFLSCFDDNLSWLDLSLQQTIGTQISFTLTDPYIDMIPGKVVWCPRGALRFLHLRLGTGTKVPDWNLVRAVLLSHSPCDQLLASERLRICKNHYTSSSFLNTLYRLIQRWPIVILKDG